MRFLSILSILCFCLALNAQRGDIPKENPDNALDLKVVFQEYTITTSNQYGATLSKEEGQYLNLKVNGLYQEDGDSGISRDNFKRYLSNCPKALDLSLDGLDAYSKSSRSWGIGRWGSLAGFIGGGVLALRSINSGNTTSTYIGAGIFAASLGLRIHSKRKAKRFERKGDEFIVDAFKLYSEECYRPELNTQITYDDGLESGDSNKDEKILIDVKSNNVNSGLLTIGGFVGVFIKDSYNYIVGPNVSIYKKGFYANFDGYLIGNIGELSLMETEDQYGGSLFLSVPLLRGSRSEKSQLMLGQMQGFESNAILDDVMTHRSLGIDLGVSRFQQYAESLELTNDYFVETTLLRGGLSISQFSEISFGVEDNRYSKNTRYSMLLARLYGNVIYNYKTSYNVLSSQFLHTDPSHNDYGFVMGLDVKYSRNKRIGNVNINVEVGKYPVQNENSGWGGRMKLGYDLYFINRSK